MRSQCHGERKFFTMQLNSRPGRGIELYRKVCTELVLKCQINELSVVKRVNRIVINIDSELISQLIVCYVSC